MLFATLPFIDDAVPVGALGSLKFSGHGDWFAGQCSSGSLCRLWCGLTTMTAAMFGQRGWYMSILPFEDDIRIRYEDFAWKRV
jgi:hypothetical protein